MCFASICGCDLIPRPLRSPYRPPAALDYYESRGQNWERAALIKARPCAGDLEAGERLLTDLSPFIWRKYLDFASVADVHAMKRQIHAYRGHEEIAVEGHNIKLGRGGIREIEFFVQTQQLIAGGRHPELRTRPTLTTLDALRSWRLDRCDGASRSRLGIPFFANDREPVADGCGRADTHVARGPRPDGAVRTVRRLLQPRSVCRSAAHSFAERAATLCKPLRARLAGRGCCRRVDFPPDADDRETLDQPPCPGFSPAAGDIRCGAAMEHASS